MKKTSFLLTWMLCLSLNGLAQQGITESAQDAPATTGDEQLNRQTCERLLGWVSQLKTTTKDKAYLQKLSDYQMQLVAIKGTRLGDLSTAGELEELKNEIEALVQAEEAKPSNQSKEEKLYTKGYNQWVEGDVEGAEKTGRSLLKDYPRYSGGYFLMGLLSYSSGDYGKTVTYMSAFLEMNPEFPNAYYFRGWAYSNASLFDRAHADFERMVELDPENVEAYFGRAYARWRKKDYTGSNEDYLRAFELDSSNATTLNNIGWNYFEMGEYEKALPWLNRSLAKNPEDGNTWDSRGETRFMMGDFAGAVEDMNKAIELSPERANSWLVRGKAYLELGEKEKSCADLHKAVELGKREGKLVIEEKCQ